MRLTATPHRSQQRRGCALRAYSSHKHTHTHTRDGSSPVGARSVRHEGEMKKTKKKQIMSGFISSNPQMENRVLCPTVNPVS